MKKVFIGMMAVSTLILFSCGEDASGDASADAASTETETTEEGTDGSEGTQASADMDLCDCINAAQMYPSKADAEEALGMDVVKDCLGKINSASAEEKEACMQEAAGVSDETMEMGKEAADMIEKHM